MDNIELEKKIDEIIANKNFFDMLIAIKNFEKDYYKTDFFKITKFPLYEIIKEYKKTKMLDIGYLTSNIQKVLNNLDFENVRKVIDQLGESFGQENEELLGSLNELKELIK